MRMNMLIIVVLIEQKASVGRVTRRDLNVLFEMDSRDGLGKHKRGEA